MLSKLKYFMLVFVLLGAQLYGEIITGVTVSPDGGKYLKGTSQTFTFNLVPPPGENLVGEVKYTGTVTCPDGSVISINSSSIVINFKKTGDYIIEVHAEGTIDFIYEDGTPGQESISGDGYAEAECVISIVSIDSINIHYLEKGKGKKAVIGFTVDYDENSGPGVIKLYANTYSWILTGVNNQGSYTVDLIEGTDLPDVAVYDVLISIGDIDSNIDTVAVVKVDNITISTVGIVKPQVVCTQTTTLKTLDQLHQVETVENSMVIYRSDAVDFALKTFLSFSVELKANLSPSEISEDIIQNWSVTSVPDRSVAPVDPTLNKAEIICNAGAAYTIKYEIFDSNDFDPHYVYVLMPLSGAGVTSWVNGDIPKSKVFADKFDMKIRMDPIGSIFNAKYYFYDYANGDYLGLPLNTEERNTFVVNSLNAMDAVGKGASGAWFGQTMRMAKASNFIVSHTLNSTDAIPQSLIDNIATLSGTSDDPVAAKSWDFGKKVAKKELNYIADGAAILNWMYFQSILFDSIRAKSWPNEAGCTTGLSSPNYLDMDPCPDCH